MFDMFFFLGHLGIEGRQIVKQLNIDVVQFLNNEHLKSVQNQNL